MTSLRRIFFFLHLLQNNNNGRAATTEAAKKESAQYIQYSEGETQFRITQTKGQIMCVYNGVRCCIHSWLRK